MNFMKGFLVASWITACLWSIYHAGHAQGKESVACHPPVIKYDFKKVPAAFARVKK